MYEAVLHGVGVGGGGEGGSQRFVTACLNLWLFYYYFMWDLGKCPCIYQYAVQQCSYATQCSYVTT